MHDDDNDEVKILSYISFPLSFPILFSDTVDDAFSNAYERMVDRLTTPYYTETDGNIDKLIQMQALQVEKAVHTNIDIGDAHKLAKATGYSLDQWGVLTHVVRRTGESDDDYRARQYTQIAIYMRSATTQDMVSTCAGVLGVAADRVMFTDGTSPTSFGITSFLIDIKNAGLTLSWFSDMMKAAKAGGVDMTLSVLGTFLPRNHGDANDVTKGTNDRLDNFPTAGTISTRFI